MHCRGCDYPLWNLPPGHCPECGVDFKPGDYEFVPASVAFCCPNCDQAYYGTSFKGHLVPARFKCVNCSTRIDMNSMVVRPAEDRPPAKQLQGVPPCMQQGRRWLVKWFGTLGWSIGMPGVLISRIPEQRSLGLAWKFFLPLVLLASLGLLLPFFMIFSGLFNLRGYLVSETLSAIASGVLTLSLTGTALILFVVVWSLFVHGWLRLTHAATYRYSRTLSTLMFSSGPLVGLAVPCLGAYCGAPFIAIWLFVLFIFGVRSGQETSTAAAVWSNFVSLFCLLIIGVALFLLGSQFTPAPAVGPPLVGPPVVGPPSPAVSPGS